MAEQSWTTHEGWSSLRCGRIAVAVEIGAAVAFAAAKADAPGASVLGVAGLLALMTGPLIGLLGLFDSGPTSPRRRNAGRSLCLIAVILPVAAVLLFVVSSTDPG